MHILSSKNHSEFLACPELIRIDHARAESGLEPTLLIKGNTLLLKYVILGAPMRLAFRKFHNHLIYALKICDDGESGGILWSIAEHQEELDAILRFSHAEPLATFIFNELAVNVAQSNLRIAGEFDRLPALLDGVEIGSIDHMEINSTVGQLVDQLHTSHHPGDAWLTFDVLESHDWKPIHNHFITNGAEASLIDIFDNNEGDQQEQLGIWLTDSLHPSGVTHSPQIPKGNGTRELTDILLSHEFGSILIESKTLSVLTRARMPNREKLGKDVTSHIKKAFAQLSGAIRSIKSGATVTNKDGEPIEIERNNTPHAIVLIPDLGLVNDEPSIGIEFIHNFITTTGGFPHLLDISELLRVAQSAEMIAQRGSTTTPMMAFDFYLTERAKRAYAKGTLRIEVLLRIVEDEGERNSG